MLIHQNRQSIIIKGMEHVICDVIVRHCINIVAAAILQLLSN